MAMHPITALNVLRKQVITGTVRGRVLFYSVSTGELMAEVFAHARAVTCISVAPESAYVLTGSEDGRFIVYKLHTRKPQAFQVEYRYSDELPNTAIMGAQFTNGRGSNIAVACFDRNAIYGYRIVKKTGT
ncbi:WD domain, G-beta repeat protein [Oesophagostomum dentatum]|uniref:WD domain, G-beta repeat protein n=1 Tax=Oesophagostomum dentatum TaxID=61180 RepID=A0A0B1TW65_OESDE|nr:WD domain, G-beta repeat protein [Oesophagostomum dentatum]